MAYRYIDGQGNEATLADRRALAHRIRLGDVTPSTLILDEDRAEWVRAGLHPTYMELVEGASGDGNRPTEIAVGAPSASSISFEPFDADMAKANRDAKAQSQSLHSSASPESARATRTPFADPAPVSARLARSGQNVPHIRRVAPRRKDRRLAVRRLIVAILAPMLALLAVLLLSGGAGLASSLSGLRDSDTDTPAPVRTDDIGVPPVGATEGLVASGDRLASRVREVRREMGLADSAPTVWLGGAYLAHAGRYPEVLEFWDAFRGLVQVLAREDLQLYRSGLEDHLRGSDLADTDRARAWLWAVRAYDVRRTQRRAVFEEFEALAAAATDLHMLLLKWANEIEHEPVGGRTLSRAPVLEALARDEKVKAEMEQVMDRVLNALGDVHGLEPVSTDRLTAALLHRLSRTTAPPARVAVVAVQ